MKTTLNIDDTIMAELKREAARQGRTMSELVESALRLLLHLHRKRKKLVALPTFHSGGTLVDIADRNALYRAMEGRLVLAVDTNVLVYVACPDWLERQRTRPDAWYTTWGFSSMPNGADPSRHHAAQPRSYLSRPMNSRSPR
jgi:hypothetical protein